MDPLDDDELTRFKMARELLPPHVRARLSTYGEFGVVWWLLASWEDYERKILDDHQPGGSPETQ